MDLFIVTGEGGAQGGYVDAASSVKDMFDVANRLIDAGLSVTVRHWRRSGREPHWLDKGPHAGWLDKGEAAYTDPRRS